MRKARCSNVSSTEVKLHSEKLWVMNGIIKLSHLEVKVMFLHQQSQSPGWPREEFLGISSWVFSNEEASVGQRQFSGISLQAVRCHYSQKLGEGCPSQVSRICIYYVPPFSTAQTHLLLTSSAHHHGITSFSRSKFWLVRISGETYMRRVIETTAISTTLVLIIFLPSPHILDSSLSYLALLLI